MLRRVRGAIHAVDGVDLAVQPATTVGLVGESGSGKSTVGRLLLRLIDVTSGTIVFDGRDITTTTGRSLREVRREIQIVFQDPHAAFDPERVAPDQCPRADADPSRTERVRGADAG